MAHAALLEASLYVGGSPRGEERTEDLWLWSRSNAQFSSDQRWLIVGNRLFDPTAVDPWSSPVKIHDDNYAVNFCALDTSCRWLAAGGTGIGADQPKQGVIRIFDLENLGSVGADRTLHDSSVTQISGLAFSSNGRWLASAGPGVKVVNLWDLQNPELSGPTKTLEFQDVVGKVEFAAAMDDCLLVSHQARGPESQTTSIFQIQESEVTL